VGGHHIRLYRNGGRADKGAKRKISKNTNRKSPSEEKSKAEFRLPVTRNPHRVGGLLQIRHREKRGWISCSKNEGEGKGSKAKRRHGR